MVLLPDELDIIVDGLLADVRKVRIMFPQVVANAAAGNGGKTGKEGCDGLLVGMEFVMPFFVLEDFLQAQGLKMSYRITGHTKTTGCPRNVDSP